MKRCFTALGFTTEPKTEAEVLERYEELRAERNGATETDRLARQVLLENCELCLIALRADA